MFLGREIENELQKREELIRELERRQTRKRFNVIGFSHEYPQSKWKPRSCTNCHVRLIQNFDLETQEYLPGLICSHCGKTYQSQSEAPAVEEIKSKHGQIKPRIITAKSRKKKYYDSQGHEINDPDLIADIQRGGITILSYHEEVPKK